MKVREADTDEPDTIIVHEFNAVDFFSSLTFENADTINTIDINQHENAAALNNSACIKAIRAVCRFIPPSWFHNLQLTDTTIVSDESVGAILRGECFESIGDYSWIQAGDPIHRIPLITWSAIRKGGHSFDPVVLLQLLERDPERLSQSFLLHVSDLYSEPKICHQTLSKTPKVTPSVQLRFLLLLRHLESSESHRFHRVNQLLQSVALNFDALNQVSVENKVAAGLVIVKVLSNYRMFEEVVKKLSNFLHENLATMDAVSTVAQKLVNSSSQMICLVT